MTPLQKYKAGDIYFSKVEAEIIEDIEKSSFKLSVFGLYNKVKSIDLIKKGILQVKENVYASLILKRSLIEHFLLAYYFFLKPKIDTSDSVGSDFYNFYANSEFLKQQTYSLQLEDLQVGKTRTIDIEVLKEVFSDIEKLTQLDIQKYHEVGSQFSNIKKIGQYLILNQNFEPKLKEMHSSIFNLLERYNVLSSYVHGGPYAERNIFRPSECGEHVYNSNDVEEWAHLLSHLAKTFLILSLKNEYGGKYVDHFKAMYN